MLASLLVCTARSTCRWLLGVGVSLAASLPPAASLLGSWLGERLQRRASEKLFLRIAGVSLAVMGGVMAYRAFMS